MNISHGNIVIGMRVGIKEQLVSIILFGMFYAGLGLWTQKCCIYFILDDNLSSVVW